MTEFHTQEDLRQMASQWLPSHRVPKRFRIHTDTSDFFGVEYDDVVILKDRPYLIRHNAKELRFGLEDEVKFWVKKAVDLLDGSQKIIKLVFYEKFMSRIGDIEFECFRSPKKEARILDLVRDYKNFMQGYSIQDEKGNLIRVLDFIKGKTLYQYVAEIEEEHQGYFHNRLPEILDHFMECIEAVRFLHEHGEKHGDIRRDHILIEQKSGDYRWIDFDFNYRHRENIYGYDLFGLGNILLFVVGRGDVLLQDLQKEEAPCLSTLREEDLNLVFHNRVVNLKKVFPFIPETLNRVLMHFSRGAPRFYDNTTQMLHDLGEYRSSIS